MAARFAKKVDPSIEIKPDQPYGEVGRIATSMLILLPNKARLSIVLH